MNILKDKKVVITAGPTYEMIDSVRFIGNMSSGKMGYAIANSFANSGTNVVLISGPTYINMPLNDSINVVKVVSADDMYEACSYYFEEADIFIMAAAVSDYTPIEQYKGKIKKKSEEMILKLKPTVDILKELSKNKKSNQIIVGFALETDDELVNAVDKLNRKNLDMIVMNSLRDNESGFGYDTNKVTIIIKGDDNLYNYPLMTKEMVADIIKENVVRIIKNKYIC